MAIKLTMELNRRRLYTIVIFLEGYKINEPKATKVINSVICCLILSVHVCNSHTFLLLYLQNSKLASTVD